MFILSIQCSPRKPHVLKTERSDMYVNSLKHAKKCFYYLSNKTFFHLFEDFLAFDQQLLLLHFVSLLKCQFSSKYDFFCRLFPLNPNEALISLVDDNFFVKLMFF